jgi:hypothetical protein
VLSAQSGLNAKQTEYTRSVQIWKEHEHNGLEEIIHILQLLEIRRGPLIRYPLASSCSDQIQTFPSLTDLRIPSYSIPSHPSLSQPAHPPRDNPSSAPTMRSRQSLTHLLCISHRDTQILVEYQEGALHLHETGTWSPFPMT